MNAKKGKSHTGDAFLQRLRDEFDQAYKEHDVLEQRVLLAQAETLYPNHDTTLQMRKDYDFDNDILKRN